MNRKECVRFLLQGNPLEPQKKQGVGHAPLNIALVKYWGKRNRELNLPVTSSFSISLNSHTHTTVETLPHMEEDVVVLNGMSIPRETTFYQRVKGFIDLVRPEKMAFSVTTINEMPTGAGLASSAAGFAALTRALNDLFSWQLSDSALSCLARLGSGSAARSLFPGFVLWEKGVREDGLDSVAHSLVETWPELLVAYVPISSTEKPISSTAAMQRTVDTSPLYCRWPVEVEKQLQEATSAITMKEFDRLGRVAESSALMMHGTMLTATPPILYWLPETVSVLHQAWQARKEGFQVYVTMDAGPNVKLLFLEEQKELLHRYFPKAKLLSPLWCDHALSS